MACGSDPSPTSPAQGGQGAGGGVAGAGAIAGASSSAAGMSSSSGSSAGGALTAAGTSNGGGAGFESAAAGGAGTAGVPGGAGAAGSGGGASNGSCTGLLCEDFEGGAIDATKWDTKTMGGTVALQSAKTAHGHYALQVHGQASGPNVQTDYAFLILHNGPPALATHHFGRANFYITPKPTSGHTGMVFAGTPGFPKPAYLEVANINSGWQLGFVNLKSPPTGEEVAYPPGQVAVENWSCLEWEFNDQPDAATLWVDGKELGKLNDQTIAYPPGHVPGSPIFNGKSSGLIGGFSDFGFGFYDWHPKNAFDLYYDDIVLDVKRVGCLPP